MRVLGERAKDLLLENRRLHDENHAALLSAGLHLGEIELAHHVAGERMYQDQGVADRIEGGGNRTARVTASLMNHPPNAKLNAPLNFLHEHISSQRLDQSSPHFSHFIARTNRDSPLDSPSGEHRSGNQEMGAGSLRVKPSLGLSVQRGNVGGIDSSTFLGLGGSPRVLSVRSVSTINIDDASSISVEHSGTVSSDATQQRKDNDGGDQEVGWQEERVSTPKGTRDMAVSVVSHRRGAGDEETATGDCISPPLSTPLSPRCRTHWAERSQSGSERAEHGLNQTEDIIRVNEQVRRHGPRGVIDEPSAEGSPTQDGMKARGAKVRSKIGGVGGRVAQACQKWEGDVRGGLGVGFRS